MERVFLAFVDFGGPFEVEAFLAGDFAHGAAGGEVAVENAEVGIGLDRFVPGTDNVLLVGVRRVRLHILEGFGDGLAGDSEAIAVEEAAVEEHLHHRADAADADKVSHAVFAEWFHVGEEGDAVADGLEVFEGERDLGGVGDGEEVENEIGGTSEREADGDRVFEGLARENIAGLDAFFQHGHDGGAGALAVLAFLFADGELGAAVGQAHAEGLDRGGHGVGSIHPTAGAGAGDGGGLDVAEAGVGELALGVFADGLEDGDDVERLLFIAVGGGETRENTPAVDEDGGAVEAGDGHHATRHIFVAATDGDEAVEALGGHSGLDGVGDDVAGDEGVAHTLRAHADAVGDGDCVEINGLAASGVDALLRVLAEFAEVDVARRHVAGGRGDGDLGFFEIFVGEADGAQHGAGGGAVMAVDDDGGVRAEGVGGLAHGSGTLSVEG